MKFSYLLIMTFLAQYVWAQPQFQDKIPQVKPLPPDAAALFKVLERPVGTFTGTVPIDFPLCSVRSGDISASLSLSYNSTGGIRVEEQASSVGLGFSLNDGAGRITQVVNGLADDHSNGLLTHSKRPSNFNCTNMQDVDMTTHPYNIDLEPDIFMYSFGGESGKFFFKEDGSIVMMQKTGIKIEFDAADVPSNGIRRWIITDEEGNKYYFGKNKAGTINYRLIQQYQYNSLSNSATNTGVSSYSWYLTEVYDMNEENKITYTYQTSGSAFTTFSGGHMEIYKVQFNCNGYNIIPDQATVQTSASEYIVSRIDANDGYILINATANRLDGTSRKVNRIELYTPGNKLVKKYTFNYGYFNNSSSDPLIKRLKLLNFAERGSGTGDSLAFRFEYNETQNLPSRLSSRVDLWGFHNGQFNNTFFPNVVFRSGSVLIRKTNLANRNASGTYASSNILKKIIYPTGGYREFDYEGNTALTSFNVNEYHPDPSNSIGRSFNRTDFANIYDFAPSLTQFFQVNSTDGGALFGYNIIDPYPSTCSGRHVKLFKLTSANQATGGQQIYDMYSDNYSHNLNNGYYRLEVYRNVGCSLTSISGNWTECTLSTGTVQTPHYPYGSFNENNRPVGGVRIKEIRDYDPVTNKIAKTQYRYKLYSTDSTRTSGLLILQPDLVTLENISGVGCQYYKMLPSSHYPLATYGGSYVVYPEVRTIESGNGWTDRIFKFVPDDPPMSFPYIPPTDNSAYRGQLLQEKNYKQNGTLIKKTTNTYTNHGWQVTQGGYKVKAYWYDAVNGTWYEYAYMTNLLPTTAACNWYSLRGNAFDLFKTIDSTYTDNGVHVTQVQYDYDKSFNNRLFLKRINTTLDNGQIRRTILRYAFNNNSDYTFGLTAGEQTMKSTLLSKNYLVPLETVDSLLTSGTDYLLGGKKFIFGTFNTNKLHLGTLRQYTSPTDYTDLNFTSYSAYGRLQEQYKQDDAKEAFLWGYGGNYPVAKVIGSTYSTLSGYVNSSVLNSPASSEHLKAELQKIRSGLSATNAQVATFTFEPLTGMSTSTDARGISTYFSYDAFNRLALIQDHEKRILKRHCYNYQGQSGACSLYGNVQKSGPFTRNNCSPGYHGAIVNYTVIANTYYAATQAEADQKAQDDVNANGQTYANANGTCIPD